VTRGIYKLVKQFSSMQVRVELFDRSSTAKAIGAYVLRPSSRNRDFVTKLGADRVIDYKMKIT